MDADTLTCRSLVIAHDYDRFVISQAAPRHARAALWALYAFNYEIAKVHDVTHETGAALIRLEWWQDAVLKASTATEILREIKKHGIDRDALAALIEARRMDAAPASLDALADYASACNAPLIRVACALAGEAVSDEACDSLARAYGLCGAIRAVPFMAAQKRCLIPTSLLYEIGLMPEQIHLLGPSQKLNDVVAMIAAQAWKRLEAAEADTPLLRRHKAVTAFYLKRIGQAGFNPFDARVYAPVPFLGLRVMMA